ncbi:MAG TPA: hypothetical protein VLH56_16825 [Dissulfurispiraceae bacterium]|nr:hypothetical protein [Dissulfurispiraceae bacterium]
MKTLNPTKPRYQEAIEHQNQQAGLLLQLLGMTPEEFYTLEFNCGLELLESYWRDMKHARINNWKDQLTGNPAMGYWRWFANFKRQEDALFLNDYQAVYDDNLADHGRREATRMMDEEYRIHLRALGNCQYSHNRLYYFITQHKTLIV